MSDPPVQSRSAISCVHCDTSRQGPEGGHIVTLAFEALFLPLLAAVVVAYVRAPDPTRRDVALIFTAMAVLFIRDMARELFGPLPILLNTTASALQYLMPYLTLRLTAQLRPVPTWLLRGTLAVYVGQVIVLVLRGTPPSPMSVAVVTGAFVVTGSLAATTLATGARPRAGSPRVRMLLAAGATALFVIAVAVSATGVIGPDVRAWTRTLARGIGLLAAFGYAVAFFPPAWLRRMWSATSAYHASLDLLQIPPDASAQQVWQRMADLSRQLTGTDGAVVLLRTQGGTVMEVAGSGLPVRPERTYPVAWLEALLSANRPLALDGVGARTRRTARIPSGAVDLASTLVGRLPARYVTSIPLDLPDGDGGALVLLSGHRTLFTDDDAVLLGGLGRQAALLGERAGVLAEQERLAEELASSVVALTHASQAKSEFLSNMSHELRTPLNAIIGFSELMQGEEWLDEHRRAVPDEWIAHVRSSGRHLLELINDVLDLAKVESGRMDLHPEPLDLPAIVEDAVAALRPEADRQRIELAYEVPHLVVHADRIRMRQILDNLLSNALKFTPPGGRVSVSAEGGEGRVRVSVTDTGIGIAPEDQHRVFHEFQQVGDRSAHPGGTGLGLALTRRLVEEHGGVVALESAPGRGSRFTVELPGGHAAPRTTQLNGGALGRILLIEDDPGATRLLRTYLERAGYQVIVAGDGDRGLNAARAESPTAILLDILLPGTDGWDILRALKRDEALRDIPVVIVTVLDEQEVGLALGAVDYFVKPIVPEALLARLSRLALLPEGGSTSAQILVIDTDPETSAVLGRTLIPLGYQVQHASSGVTGLRAARGASVGLILCDLLLPDIDGFTVIAALHDDPATRRVPVLALTSGELSDTDKSRLNGKIAGVLQKGDEVPAALQQWLNTTARATAAAGRSNGGTR